jgi:predicted RNA-binding protein with EMAP domain
MEEKKYRELTSETLRQLKELGYTGLKVQLLAIDDPYQATAEPFQAIVEAIPGEHSWRTSHSIKIDSQEAALYVDVHSPMARYVVNEEYLKGKEVGNK